MIELLRNCSHGSETATYRVTESSGRFIRKAASTPEGIAQLLAEAQGWEWYRSRRSPSNALPPGRAVSRPSYTRLDIDWIDGDKGDYTQGLLPNAARLRAAIAHYIQVWDSSAGDRTPLHGDLSIDNILFQGNAPYFVDWEHFQMEGAPWGFDALYLLFETLYFGIRGRRLPTIKEYTVLAEQIGTLRKAEKLSENFSSHPLETTIDFIKSHKPIWGGQLQRYPGKLPLLSIPENTVAAIERGLSPWLAHL